MEAGAAPLVRSTGVVREDPFKEAVILIRPVLVIGAVVCGTVPLSAQQIPWSQRGEVHQRVAFTDISITYNRPVARGRTLFGDLVKWDTIWHPGADSATTMRLSSDVIVEGETLTAGRYTLWTIPSAERWTIIFSRAVDIYHSPYPGEEHEALRITVIPERGDHMETLAFYFPTVDGNRAMLRLHWGDVVVPLRIEALEEP